MKKKKFNNSKEQKFFAAYAVFYLVELAYKFRLAAEGKYDFNQVISELASLVKSVKE